MHNIKYYSNLDSYPRLAENGLDEFSIVSPVRGHDEMRREVNGI